MLIPLFFVTGCLAVAEIRSVVSQESEKPTISPFAATSVATTTIQQTAFPSPTMIETATPNIPDEPAATLFPDLTEEKMPIGETTYQLPLTIRHLREDGAVLFFELSEPGEGYLLYQEVQVGKQGETQAFPLSTSETRQQIVLDQLTPNTEYLAMVGLKDAQGILKQPAFLGESWGSVRFKTLPGQGPLRVGIFGDASFGDLDTKALMQQMVSQDLDFAIHTGDVVAEIQENSGPIEAYALKYYQTLSPLLHQMPIFTIIGNHDYNSPARWMDSYFYYYAFPLFPDPLFDEALLSDKLQYYAIAYHEIQFLMLDSQVIFGVDGREAQDAWMADRLADRRFRYTIPVLHVPPFFSGSVHPEDQIPVRQSWHHIFASARVPLALSGHSHHYERLAVDGITYIVSGGGSGVLYAPGDILPQSQVFARRTHFVLMEIYSDSIELSVIDKNGELFDHVTIPLP